MRRGIFSWRKSLVADDTWLIHSILHTAFHICVAIWVSLTTLLRYSCGKPRHTYETWHIRSPWLHILNHILVTSDVKWLGVYNLDTVNIPSAPKRHSNSRHTVFAAPRTLSISLPPTVNPWTRTCWNLHSSSLGVHLEVNVRVLTRILLQRQP